MTDANALAASGLLDPDFYGRQAGLSFASAEAALAHYDAEGWRRGLAPSRLFDTRFYLRRNPDIRDAGMNPLRHYCEAGRREGRKPRIGRTPLADRAAAPPEARWDELAELNGPEPDDGPEAVDVVAPVYRGRDDTLACLASVLASRNRTPFRLIVIEDASPEPELVEDLRRLADRGLFTLLQNNSNLGFVETANRGLGLSHERDVVLLNSDTVVYGDWLDRLRAHAGEGVASVTPLSNNATILSYPYAPGNNNQVLELPDPELDGLFAEVNRGRSAEIPTGVGFCFYLPRAALRALGGFDPVFSPGYGEENDFCMRAQKAGWRNLAALDVFVRHTGETSFNDTTGRKAAAGALLRARHPDYDAQVSAFMAADPLRPARAEVDFARAARLSGGRGVLMVDHGWGGGVERHLRDLAGFLEAEGRPCFRLFPTDNGALRLEPLGPYDLPNLPELSLDRPEAAAEALRRLSLAHAHVHSAVGVPVPALPKLAAVLDRAELAYDFSWHDYAPLCPRLSMVDWGGVYCDSPSTAYCQVCMEKAGSRFGPVDVAAWRETYRRFVGKARRNIVPDADVAERLSRYSPGLAVQLRPHPLTEQPRVGPPATRPASDVRVVGVLGRLGPMKGSGVLLRAAGDALERKLPLRFRIHGSSSRAELRDFPNVEFAGEYLEEEIDSRLAADRPDLLFFPSVCPETFSYTLDVALRTRLHPVCFAIGAPARRLGALRTGTVLPLELALDAPALNDALLAVRPGQAPAPIEEGRRWRSADWFYGPD